MLQAYVFEYMDRSVQNYPTGVGMQIPQWAWDEFYPGQPYRSTFNVYDATNPAAGMLFDDSYNSPAGHQLEDGFFLD